MQNCSMVCAGVSTWALISSYYFRGKRSGVPPIRWMQCGVWATGCSQWNTRSLSSWTSQSAERDTLNTSTYHYHYHTMVSRRSTGPCGQVYRRSQSWRNSGDITAADGTTALMLILLFPTFSITIYERSKKNKMMNWCKNPRTWVPVISWVVLDKALGMGHEVSESINVPFALWKSISWTLKHLKGITWIHLSHL